MRNITASGNLYGEQITIKQISKRTAEKLFNEGKTIYLQSSKLSPFNMWQNVFDINNEKAAIYHECDFETIVNNYSYYNCDSERGKYVTFYAKVF